MSDDRPEVPNDLPETPLTALAEGAAHLHEMYTAYLEAGFPEQRAFDLVSTVLMSYLEN